MIYSSFGNNVCCPRPLIGRDRYVNGGLWRLPTAICYTRIFDDPLCRTTDLGPYHYKPTYGSLWWTDHDWSYNCPGRYEKNLLSSLALGRLGIFCLAVAFA